MRTFRYVVLALGLILFLGSGGAASIAPCDTAEGVAGAKGGPALRASLAPKQGNTYYVDIDDPAASDSNPGTEALPWRHCPGMSGWTGSATLEAGDTVFFSSAGTWTSSDGSALLQVVGGVTYDGKAWGGGTRATLRATAGFHRAVINLMEDHPVEPTVVRGFEADANGQVTSGITINWPQSQGSMIGATKRIEDCVVHGVVSQSAQGQYEYGIVVSSGYGGGRTVRNVEILDCTTYDISRGGVNVYSANDDPNSTIENVIVRGCDIYNTGQDPDYAGSGLALKNHIIDVTAEYNYVHHATRGMGIGISSHNEQFRGPENLVVRYNIVRENPQMGIVLNLWGSADVEIYGNLIMKNTYQGIRFMRAIGTLSVRIYNNTLLQNHYPGWSHEILVGSSTANIPVLEIRNNILIADPDTTPLVDTDGDITGHSNNLYFRPGGGTLVSASGVDYTAATIHSWEPTALAGDPRLRDLTALPGGFVGAYGVDLRPYPDGLNLSADSPARDAGAPLGASYASSVNSVARPWGSGWDVGAYEYVPALELRGTPGDATIYLYWSVDGLESITGWHIDYYTQTLGPPFTATDPYSLTRSYVLTENVYNGQWYTVTLYAMAGAASVMSDTVRVMPKDKFVHLPLVLKAAEN